MTNKNNESNTLESIVIYGWGIISFFLSFKPAGIVCDFLLASDYFYSFEGSLISIVLACMIWTIVWTVIAIVPGGILLIVLDMIFNDSTNNNNKQTVYILSKDNVLDVSYAFGVLATLVAQYDYAYVQAIILDDHTTISAMLAPNICKYKEIENLTNPSDLVKLDVPEDIANLIASLNCTYKHHICTLEVDIKHVGNKPSNKEIEAIIYSSKKEACLPVKYVTEISQDRTVLIRMED